MLLCGSLVYSMLLSSLLLYDIMSSPLTSYRLVSLLCWSPLLSCAMTHFRKWSDGVDPSQNYANTSWSSLKPFSLFFLLRKHTSLFCCSDRLQFDETHKQFCQSFSCFQISETHTPCFSLVSVSSQFQRSAAHNKTHLRVCCTHFLYRAHRTGLKCEKMRQSACRLHQTGLCGIPKWIEIFFLYPSTILEFKLK